MNLINRIKRWFQKKPVYEGGAIPDVPDKRDWRYNQHFKVGGAPDKVSLIQYFPPIGNQFTWNNCVNWALADILFALQNKKHDGKYDKEFSKFYLWNLTRLSEGTFGKNVGLQSRNALNTLIKHGITFDELFEHSKKYYGKDISKVKPDNMDIMVGQLFKTNFSDIAYYRDKTLDEIKTSLANGHGVYVAMRITKSMFNSLGTISYKEGDKVEFGHAVVIVEVDGENVLIRNSWGRDWGLNGHAWISWGDLEKAAYDIFSIRRFEK